MEEQKVESRKIFGISKNAFIFGFVSMLNDFSSDMTVKVLPLFLKNVLGVNTAIIGLIEGIADSTATLLKIFSGWISDRLGKRKFLVTIGYSISAITKPLLFFAGNWIIVLLVRFGDRVGKGIRTSPRDALIADTTDKKDYGKTFGFNRAADPFGAVLGLTAAGLVTYFSSKGAMLLSQDLFRKLIIISIVPVFLAVLLIIFFVKEAKPQTDKTQKVNLSLKGFDLNFKIFLLILFFFSLGNSSDAFLVLKAQATGLSIFQIFLMLALFNLMTSLSAIPAGAISDRIGRQKVITFGWLIYAFIYIGFAFAQTANHVWLLFVLYGIYYGATEGAAKALVADLVPSEKRGTAYGLYNGAIGVAALPASLIAGILWQLFGSQSTFIFGSVLAFISVVGLIYLETRRRKTCFY